MKKLIALSVLVLVGVSISASSAFAFGNCAGKAKAPVKKITEAAPPATTSG